MNNQELKVKFEEVQVKIENAKVNNQDIKALLHEKYDLLKMAYEKIKIETSAPEFDKNPKKYSTLLSYIKTMKETAKEAGMTTLEADKLEDDVKTKMKENNLDWLLNNQ